MRIFRRMMLAFLAVLLLPLASFGQVMTQVPSNAMFAVRVKNLADLSQKIAALSVQLGLPPGATPMSDALGFLTKKLGLTQGLNAQGDFAFALLDLGNMNGPTPPILLLIPVTDYKTALSNYPNATTDGAVSTIQMPDGATAYMASWGNYAALSPTRDCVTATPGGLTITPTAAKELDAHDICDLFNMPQVRTRVLPVFMASRQMVMMQMSMAFSQQPTMAKYAPALKVFIGQALDLVQNFISQCDDVTLGASLSPDGISGAVVMDFNSTSHYGQMVASITDTDKSLLGGIPAGNYLLFGGAVTDPKVSSQFISEFLDPVLPELQNLGADGQPYLDAIQSLKDNAAAQTGGSVAFLVPEGELGTSPLMQFIAVKNGDAKTISASVDKILQTEADQAKAGAAGGPAGMSLPMQMTYTPAAKTVDGVTFDQFHTGFDMAGALTPQIAKIGQYLSFLYGSDGMNIYGGIVNDATYLQVGGLTDDKISTAIAAARSGDDPLAKLTGVQNTAAKLPTQRVAAFYVPLDTIVNTVFTYMGKFGLDMGVTMPASDPIGVVSSTDGSAVRIDLYVPGQLITSSAQVAGKLMLHRAGANPGGGPPPPPGGGL